MKKIFTITLIGFLAACSAKEITEEQQKVINYCAQENFQCESSCESVNIRESLATGVCKNKCIDQHNMCKGKLESEFTK